MAENEKVYTLFVVSMGEKNARILTPLDKLPEGVKVTKITEGKASQNKNVQKFVQAIDNACFTSSPEGSLAVKDSVYLAEVNKENTPRINRLMSEKSYIGFESAGKTYLYDRVTLLNIVNVNLAMVALKASHWYFAHPDMSKTAPTIVEPVETELL